MQGHNPWKLMNNNRQNVQKERVRQRIKGWMISYLNLCILNFANLYFTGIKFLQFCSLHRSQ